MVGVIDSLKSASEFVSKLTEITKRVEIDAVRIDLQSEIMGLQSALLAANNTSMEIQEALKACREEKMHLKQTLSELERYALKELGPGAFAYAIKPESQGGDPVHWICAGCRDQGQRSILQRKGQTTGTDIYGCPRCEAEIRVPNAANGPDIRTTGRRRMDLDGTV